MYICTPIQQVAKVAQLSDPTRSLEKFYQMYKGRRINFFGFSIEISRQKQTESSHHNPDPASWNPTHRHKKGGQYRHLYEGVLENDLSAVVIYDDREGQVWVRSTKEFHDGRFQPIETD